MAQAPCDPVPGCITLLRIFLFLHEILPQILPLPLNVLL